MCFPLLNQSVLLSVRTVDGWSLHEAIDRCEDRVNVIFIKMTFDAVAGIDCGTLPFHIEGLLYFYKVLLFYQVLRIV